MQVIEDKNARQGGHIFVIEHNADIDVAPVVGVERRAAVHDSPLMREHHEQQLRELVSGSHLVNAEARGPIADPSYLVRSDRFRRAHWASSTDPQPVHTNTSRSSL